MRLRILAVLAVAGALALAPRAPAVSSHPRLLFDASELEAIRERARQPGLAPVAERVMARAERLLGAPPLLVSTTKRGEPDPPGHLKGIEAARRLQGRTATHAMAFLLSGDRRFRDAAVAELDRALSQWPIWVDTAHQPPFDLMTGELSLTFGLAYDWLHDSLSPEERTRLREGVERRALTGYLESVTRPQPAFWFSADHNWNPVCNGGAAVLAVSLGDDSVLSRRVIALAAPAMAPYWNHLATDGAWDEGTGYWAYGHRYAFMAADALRRAGRPEGRDYLGRQGARTTGYFPIIFNPGTVLSASFGDSAHRVADAILYYLAREYKNPDFAWFEDRVAARPLDREGWPDDALSLVWRGATAPGEKAGRPRLPDSTGFSSIGWAMLTPGQPDPRFFLAFKNGSLAANHTHLDLNHLSVAVGDTMLLPDLGSRPYPADYFTASKRYGYYEISTAGHNTVLVGGKGQVPGRIGVLRGPFEGKGYTAFTGVADNAYEVSTPKARRHVVLVDRRYYVVVDEIEPASPASIELRFHTYGKVESSADAGGEDHPARGQAWSVTLDGAALHVVAADRTLTDERVEAASGWIKPVNVLRLGTRQPVGQFLLATVILPSPAPAPAVSQELRGNRFVVRVGRDRIEFGKTPDGWSLQGVEAHADR